MYVYIILVDEFNGVNMYSFKKYFLLLIIFLSSYLIMYFTQYNHINGDKSQNYWRQKPIIVNCYYNIASDEILKNAVSFWLKRGYEIESIKNIPNDKLCEYSKIDGVILIKIANYENIEKNTLAYTEIEVDDQIITSATIYMQYDTFSYRLLIEHELGHSFGIKHVNEIGNIMNPTYEFMGNNY